MTGLIQTDEGKFNALRAPFPAELVGKLPKLACKECTRSPDKVCSRHEKKKCTVCGNYISTAHVDLDYVGHAATTDRLLQVDPTWTWEPMAIGPGGEPLIVGGGLWIRLTVCGVTRPGWGDGDTIKVMIGDAIRNAAMRFGVALDLWAKEDLHVGPDESGAPATGAAVGAPQIKTNVTTTNAPPGTIEGGTNPDTASDAQRRKLFAVIRELDKTQPKAEGQLSWDQEVRQFLTEKFGADSTKALSKREMGETIDHFEKLRVDGEAPF